MPTTAPTAEPKGTGISVASLKRAKDALCVQAEKRLAMAHGGGDCPIFRAIFRLPSQD